MEIFFGRMDIGVAYGIDVAVFLENLKYWSEKNASIQENFIDGRYWVYHTLGGFAALYPIWSRDQVKRIIAKCKDAGLVLVADYNNDPYKRTKWYSLSDKALELFGVEVTPDGEWRNRPVDWRNRHVEEGKTATCDVAISPHDIEVKDQKERIEKKDHILAHLKKLQDILAGGEVSEDSREADMSIISALEANGYVCQNGVPVPSRGGDSKYTGRIGVVAAKDGVVIAIETDRKSVRDKSIHKLRNYPCDIRLVLLRGGEAAEPPAGIDAVIPLRVKSVDDYFHAFWDEYPKKVDKRRAYEVFKRLKVTPEMLGVMLRALKDQKQSKQWREANGQYIPHATTWLNGRRWEDVPMVRPTPEALPGLVVERDGVPVW